MWWNLKECAGCAWKTGISDDLHGRRQRGGFLLRPFSSSASLRLGGSICANTILCRPFVNRLKGCDELRPPRRSCLLVAGRSRSESDEHPRNPIPQETTLEGVAAACVVAETAGTPSGVHTLDAMGTGGVRSFLARPTGYRLGRLRRRGSGMRGGRARCAGRP